MRLLPITSCLLLLALSLSAQVAQLRWDVQVDRPVPHEVLIWQGETVDLMPRLVQGTAPVAVTNAPVEFRYREAALATDVYRYVTADPNTNTGVLAVRWIPDYDAGAAFYDYQIIVGSNAANPRAFGRITMRPTIGWQASTSPPPAILQYATTAQVQAASNALAEALQPIGPRLDLIEGRTNYWDLAYFWGVEWLDWLNTNTYVRAEGDALALEALAAFAATNRPAEIVSEDGRYKLSLVQNMWQSSSTNENAAVKIGRRSIMVGPADPLLPGATASYGRYSLTFGAGLAGTWTTFSPDGIRYGGLFADENTLFFPMGAGEKSGVTETLATEEHVAQVAASRDELTAATNAIVRTYFASSNAWIEVDYSNKTAAVVLVGTEGTNSVLLSEAGASLDPAATNTIWIAINQNYNALSAALGGKAPLAWGNSAPDGTPNPEPDYMLWLNRPATMFASGYTWATCGTYAALTADGTVAFESGGEGALRIGPDPTNHFGYAVGGSVIVGARTDSLTVYAGGTSNGYAEIVYDYEGGGFPVAWFTPSLAVAFTEVPDAQWTDNLDGTATLTAPATAATGFWRATTSAEIDSVFVSTMPARFDGGVLGGTNALPVIYDSVIQIESGGKTYRIPAQEVQ